jgi:hypothetical protein
MAGRIIPILAAAALLASPRAWASDPAYAYCPAPSYDPGPPGSPGRTIPVGNGAFIQQWFPCTWRVTTTYRFPSSAEYDASACPYWSLRLLVPIPTSDEYHAVANLQAPGGSVRLFGNGRDRFLAYEFNRMPDTVTVSYDITVPDTRVDFPDQGDIPPWDPADPMVATFSRATTGSVNPDHPKVAAIADRLWAESAGRLDYIRRVFEYLRSGMDYQTTGEYSLDGIFHLGYGGRPAGDCGAFSILYVSLLRRHGVPARLVNGWVIQDSLNWVSHLWSEFYVQGQGWVCSDATFGQGFFAHGGTNRVHLNRGEEMTGAIGDWTSAWHNGRQAETYRIDHSGPEPRGAFNIRRETTVTRLSAPDIAGYYQEPTRVERLTDAIVAGIGRQLGATGTVKPRRSAPLEQAARLQLAEDAPGWRAALEKAGFSWRSSVWLLHLRLAPVFGTDPAADLLAELAAHDYSPRLLYQPNIGLAYRFKDGMHDYYFISADGKPSGNLRLATPARPVGTDEAFTVGMTAAAAFDKDDWIGLYEAGETPDGDPQAIWWAWLPDLRREADGSFRFDPAGIPAAQRPRWQPGREYKFITAYFGGYQVESEARFTTKGP